MAILIGAVMDGGGHWGSDVCIVGGILYQTDELATDRRRVVLRYARGSGSRRRRGNGVIRIRDILRGVTIM